MKLIKKQLFYKHLRQYKNNYNYKKPQLKTLNILFSNFNFKLYLIKISFN